jgi:hypothetical protein
MPPNTVKVDRTTLFGNPFSLGDYGHDLHRRWIKGKRIDPSELISPMPDLASRKQDVLRALPNLRGENLACWCALQKAGDPDCCHAAMLLELANR